MTAEPVPDRLDQHEPSPVNVPPAPNYCQDAAAPYYADDDLTVWAGDCRAVLAGMAADSVDAIVTDPPYGLEFMGREWDRPWAAGRDVRQPGDPDYQHTAGNPYGAAGVRHGIAGSYGPNGASASRAFGEWSYSWAVEALRVAKPGAHLVAFGGTRTWHRLACALEDAGWEVRDTIMWLYGSGFPKSHDVSKAIDKAAGATREIVAPGRYADRGRTATNEVYENPGRPSAEEVVTAPSTEDAARWAGWGTALKPAWEPIILARKPLAGTVVDNVLAHGVGGLNVDGCRVPMSQADAEAVAAATWVGAKHDAETRVYNRYATDGEDKAMAPAAGGRWPANLTLSHAAGCTPAGEVEVASDGHYPAARPASEGISTDGHAGQTGLTERSTAGERVTVWACVDGCPVAMLNRQTGDRPGGSPVAATAPSSPFGGDVYQDMPGRLAFSGYADAGGAARFYYTTKAPGEERPVAQVDGRRVAHPTVKPVALMRWLVRLVCPAGGVVLDPFAGSGTTLEAAVCEGARAVGVELTADYLPLIVQRLSKPLPVALF